MKETYHLGLIGYPLGHSRSPQLHHAALKAYGLHGEYSLFPIPPLPEGEAQIRALIQRLRAGDLHGLNVTIPHKPSVMPHVDRLTPVAQAVGAVNTLYLDRQGMLIGDNTDVPGFYTDVSRLLATSVEIGQRKALVLGAGGSARAVAYALAQAGWVVWILARRVVQAQELVESLKEAPELAGAQLQFGSLTADCLQSLSVDCHLMVNTTPLGMFPKPEASPWPEEVPFPASAVVYDLVYNPIETLLVRQARRAGLAADTGAGMLVNQAALAFARWTELEPPFEVMNHAFFQDDKGINRL